MFAWADKHDVQETDLISHRVVQFFLDISCAIHHTNNCSYSILVIHGIKYEIIVYRHGAKIAALPSLIFILLIALRHMV